MQTRRPLIIDCDTGRDDALAILLALAFDMNLGGVVGTYGNTTIDNVLRNSLSILTLAGRPDIPVLYGATTPLAPHPLVDAILLPKQAGAGNGLCNLTLPYDAARLPAPETPDTLAARLTNLVGTHGPVDYVITGNATSFAHVCRTLGPDIKKLVARVTLWAGKLDGLWQTMPGAEFNTACDPLATQTVLKSGVPVRFIPMDTTWPIVLSKAQLENLRPATPVASFAKDLMIAHCRHFAPEPVFRFHDPSVIYALAHPDAFTPLRLRIETDPAHPQFGRTISDDCGTPVDVYLPDAAARDTMLARMLLALGFDRSC